MKTLLALGVAAGGLMLAQAMVTTPEAAAQGGTANADCLGDQQCGIECEWIEKWKMWHYVGTCGREV